MLNILNKLLVSVYDKKYCSLSFLAGGFIFKQWKKRFLLLTAEGSLLVCHDASSPPDQLVHLQGGCETIVEGKEILDLPKLPSGGSRDCCFALILPQNKYLLLMTETTAECRFVLLCKLFVVSPHIVFSPPVTLRNGFCLFSYIQYIYILL